MKLNKFVVIFLVINFFILTSCSQSHDVAVVGGSDNSEKMLNSIEVYDPTAGTFSVVPSTMSTGRMTATATTLGNNTVLIAGGQGSGALNSAEIYQPLNNNIALTAGNMNHPRVAHTATFLDPAVVSGSLSGQVLITGGDAFSTIGTAELYNTATNLFSNTGNMSIARRQHTATLISHCGCAADGSVLITGGYDNQSNVLASAELYNPTTQVFTPVGNLLSPRFRHTATLLNDGTVLITGGASQMAAKPGNINPALNSAEIYSPKTGKFTQAKGVMSSYREGHAASLLQDGTVLITGGQDNHFLIENSAELYNPTTSTFTAITNSCAGSPPPTGCMTSSRDFHISQTLDDGRVLIAGGVNSQFSVIASAEIYNPANKTFNTTGSMSTPRDGAAACLIIK